MADQKLVDAERSVQGRWDEQSDIASIAGSAPAQLATQTVVQKRDVQQQIAQQVTSHKSGVYQANTNQRSNNPSNSECEALQPTTSNNSYTLPAVPQSLINRTNQPATTNQHHTPPINAQSQPPAPTTPTSSASRMPLSPYHYRSVETLHDDYSYNADYSSDSTTQPLSQEEEIEREERMAAERAKDLARLRAAREEREEGGCRKRRRLE